MLHDDGLRRRPVESRPSPKIVASVAKSKCDWRLVERWAFRRAIIENASLPLNSD